MKNVFLLSILALYSLNLIGKETVYFVASWPLFVDFPTEYCKTPYLYLRDHIESMGYACVQIDCFELSNLFLGKNDYLICVEAMPIFTAIISEKKFNETNLILLNLEPPIIVPSSADISKHNLFGKILTWNEDLVDNKKYFKLNYYAFDWLSKPKTKCFKKKKLLTLLSGNKTSVSKYELYSARRRIIDFFENNSSSDFDFYGPGWDASKYKTYAGNAANRIECVSNYKFCVCFENSYGYTGYLTEKLLNCLWSGVVPIYYGDPYVNKYIPQNCFIDGTMFVNDPKALYDFLKKIDETEYLAYLKNIENFVNSKNFDIFKYKFFADTIVRVVLNKKV